MPSPTIRYPNAVFGLTAGDPVLFGDVVGYFVTSATVTAGQAVIIDTTNLGQVKPAATNSAGVLCIGVCGENGVANDVVAVTLVGRTTVLSNTAITSGDRLGLDATTAANLATVTAATAVTQAKDTGNIIAVALETVTAGITSVRCYIKPV